MPCQSFLVPGIGWRLGGWKPASPAVRMTERPDSGLQRSAQDPDVEPSGDSEERWISSGSTGAVLRQQLQQRHDQSRLGGGDQEDPPGQPCLQAGLQRGQVRLGNQLALADTDRDGDGLCLPASVNSRATARVSNVPAVMAPR